MSFDYTYDSVEDNEAYNWSQSLNGETPNAYMSFKAGWAARGRRASETVSAYNANDVAVVVAELQRIANVTKANVQRFVDNTSTQWKSASENLRLRDLLRDKGYEVSELPLHTRIMNQRKEIARLHKQATQLRGRIAELEEK